MIMQPQRWWYHLLLSYSQCQKERGAWPLAAIAKHTVSSTANQTEEVRSEARPVPIGLIVNVTRHWTPDEQQKYEFLLIVCKSCHFSVLFW